jgi:putative phosphoribosyl transferase
MDHVEVAASSTSCPATSRSWPGTRPARAVPVSSRDAVRQMRDECYEAPVVETPPTLGAIAAWYADFRQVSDAQVHDLLDARRSPA